MSSQRMLRTGKRTAETAAAGGDSVCQFGRQKHDLCEADRDQPAHRGRSGHSYSIDRSAGILYPWW